MGSARRHVPIRVSLSCLDQAYTSIYALCMCDLSRDEQGALASLLGNLQAAEASVSTTFPEVFTRAWADHEAMLAGLEDLTVAAGQIKEWVAAKHHSAAV